MKDIFALLQQKGYDIGCDPSEDVPSDETFCAANRRFLPNVLECAVTFPVLTYFRHHHDLRQQSIVSLLHKHLVGIVLRCDVVVVGTTRATQQPAVGRG